MKERYAEVEVEVIRFSSEDVITASYKPGENEGDEF